MARDFPAAQQKANKEYYSSRGKNIYSDFSTFAQGKALATCNAIEFVRDFSNHPAPVVVCEYGVGKGDFAKTFLDEVKKRDSRLCSRTRYYLFDFSEKMLADARRNLKAHAAVCIFGKFDAAREVPSLPFDYCRINELLTDIPAEIYVKKEGAILDLDGKPAAADIFAQKFLERVEEGRAIPFNFDAEKFLLSLCRAGKKDFRIDLFDYGFYSAEDVFLLPIDEWNRTVSRKYGTQITVDLNFLQMLFALEQEGFSAKIEKQKEYAEKALGFPLELSDKEDCLDYVKAKKQELEISEDDGFYHLRAGR